MTTYTGEIANILELADITTLEREDIRAEAIDTLENGGIIYLPQPAFTLSDAEFRFVSDASVTLPTKADKRSQNGRPTIIYNPETGRLERSRIRSRQRPQLTALLDRYARWSTDLIHRLFPAYQAGIVRDRTTYRPCERAATQGLHVDASYGRPTGGQSMLRVFCNINPEARVRTWRVGETFEPFARRYVTSARPKQDGALEKLLARFGITKGHRTPYDLLMEDIRSQVKRDAEYQAQAPQKVVDFPAGTAWIALTDLVLHGAVSGQHSLDQTFFVPDEIMADPDRSSLHILERLTGRSLRSSV
ncbi:Kdo hydroxylase family protein [Salinisphaera sp. RV14]|uniref:Kdo hydroxylase family protein n=1 Tax=unclassified Salinisphaera TaxID=2649847 RepID=UPI003F8507F6